MNTTNEIRELRKITKTKVSELMEEIPNQLAEYRKSSPTEFDRLFECYVGYFIGYNDCDCMRCGQCESTTVGDSKMADDIYYFLETHLKNDTIHP